MFEGAHTPRPSPETIDGAVSGDAAQPSGRCSTRSVVGVRAGPRLDEHLLQDFFCFGALVQDPDEETEQQVAVPIVELADGVLIAPGDSIEDGEVVLQATLNVHHWRDVGRLEAPWCPEAVRMLTSP